MKPIYFAIVAQIMGCAPTFGENLISFTTNSGTPINEALVFDISPEKVIFTVNDLSVEVTKEEIPEDVLKRLGFNGMAQADITLLSVSLLDSLLNLELEQAESPITQFNATYLSYLEDLSKKTQQEGDLDRVLKVKKEMETFHNGEPRVYIGFPKLEQLRAVYELNIRPLETKVFNERTKIHKLYVVKLGQLKTRYTREGQLERALEASNEQKRIESVIKSERQKFFPTSKPVEEEPKPEPLWGLKSRRDYTTTGGIIIDERNGVWELEKGDGVNTRISPDRDFSPPFNIVVRLKPETDSHVRIMYDGDWLSQFNQGPNRDQLLLQRPWGARVVLNGKGELKPQTFYDIELLVRDDSLQVFIDGALAGEFDADYKGMDAPIAITPFRDCPLALEKFEVWPIE